MSSVSGPDMAHLVMLSRLVTTAILCWMFTCWYEHSIIVFHLSIEIHLTLSLQTVYVAYRLLGHRRDFRKLVNTADSALTTSRFVRLGLLSTAFFLFNLPLSIYSITRLLPGIGPYIHYDWAYIHSEVCRSYRSLFWALAYAAPQFNYVKYNPLKSKADFGDWSVIIAGMLVTVFFGFGAEAMKYYSKPLYWMGLLNYKHTTDSSLKHVQVSHITLTQ